MNVVQAIAEFFKDEHVGAEAVACEDVRPQAGGEVGESDVGVELLCTFGAFERVVGDVGEVVLDGAFVGLYHIELSLELCAVARWILQRKSDNVHRKPKCQGSAGKYSLQEEDFSRGLVLPLTG